MVEVFVESTEDPALDEEESTSVAADSLAVVVKNVCVDRKVNIAAGGDRELDVAAAMVADALRSVAATSVPGITGVTCKLIDTCHGRPFR